MFRFESYLFDRVVNLFRKIPCVVLMKSHINAEVAQLAEHSLGRGKVVDSVSIFSSKIKCTIG